MYLETSFFSACVSDRADAGSVYRREQSRQWWATQRQHHRVVISPEVLICQRLGYIPPVITTPEVVWGT